MVLQLCSSTLHPQIALAPKPGTVNQVRLTTLLARPQLAVVPIVSTDASGNADQGLLCGQTTVQSLPPVNAVRSSITSRTFVQYTPGCKSRSLQSNALKVSDDVVKQVLWTAVDCIVQRTDQRGVHVTISSCGDEPLPGYIRNRDLANRELIRRLAAASPGHRLKVSA